MKISPGHEEEWSEGVLLLKSAPWDELRKWFALKELELTADEMLRREAASCRVRWFDEKRQNELARL